MIFLYLIEKNIDERLHNITIFERSATSDPITVESYTNSLEKVIRFFVT